MATTKYRCARCGETRPERDFYKPKSKIPIWKDIIPICKYCINDIYEELLKQEKDQKKALDNICRLLDRPFLTSVFDTCKEELSQEKYNSLITAYLSKINLAQYASKTYLDSDEFPNIQISIGVQKVQDEQENEVELIYSKEWMGKYSRQDLEYLNDYYARLNDDFKIATQNHKDYARKIAKASLAMDKAYDEMIRGVEGADKKYQMLKDTFDKLSQSAKFSENTRSQNDVGLGSFGKIFEMVENKQWIPQHTPLEKDTIDELLEYFAHINKSL